MSDEGLDGVLTRIDKATPNAITRALAIRYLSGELYSYIGNMLVAVSDCGPPPVYAREDEEIMDKYLGRGCSTLPPHVYALADEVYSAMLSSGDQFVVLSGLSGSGKTTVLRSILHYLAFAGGVDGEILPQAVMLTSVVDVLGGIVGARTLMCRTSSRYTSLISVHFDSDGMIVGGHIKLFNVGVSRVSSRLPPESSFHLFHLLLRRAAGTYNISSDYRSYRYLRGIDGTEPPPPPSTASLNAFEAAMAVFDLDYGQLTEVYTVLAAVLLVGNLEFTNVAGGRTSARTRVSDIVALDAVASLLRVSSTALESALVTRVSRVPGQPPLQHMLSPEDTLTNADAFAHSLYTLVVRHLVAHMNGRLASRAHTASITLVDPTGFELLRLKRKDSSVYSANHFEQLLVNCVNERLRAVFNYHVVAKEVALYDKEGVDIPRVAGLDNSGCRELVEDGLLALLDDMCDRLDTTNEAWLERAHSKFDPLGDGLAPPEKRLEPSDFYGRVKMDRYETDTTDFVVGHFAGDVRYSVSYNNKNSHAKPVADTGFMGGNRDHVCVDFVDLLSTSRSKAIAGLAVYGDGTYRTVSQALMTELAALETALHASHPYFVVCISPNADGEPASSFDDAWVLGQVAALGLVDALRMKHVGYPHRTQVDAFAARYYPIAFAAGHRSTSALTVTKAVLSSEGVPDTWRLGSEYVFLSAAAYAYLEELRFGVIKELSAARVNAVKTLKALVLMARARASLPALLAATAPVAERLKRKRELVSGPRKLSPDAAEAVLNIEDGLSVNEDLQGKSAEVVQEARAEVFSRARHAVEHAMRDVDEVVQGMEEILYETWDLDQQKELRGQKLELDKAVDALEAAARAVNEDWGGEGREAHLVAAASRVEELVAKNAAALPKAKQQMETFHEIEEERVVAVARQEFAMKRHEDEIERLVQLRAAEDRRLAELQREKAKLAAERDHILRDRAQFEAEREALLLKMQARVYRDSLSKEERTKVFELNKEREARKEKIAKMKAERYEKMVRAKAQAKIKLVDGLRVLYKGERATVRYIGRLPFESSGVWLGIVTEARLNEGNNGSCLGVQFFRCEENHGLFVRPASVLVVRDDEPLVPGMRAFLKGYSGIVRYVGRLHVDDGDWVGLELDEVGVGKNDGAVKDVRYFVCPPGQGVFARRALVDHAVPWDEAAFSTKYRNYCMEHKLLTDEDMRLLVDADPRLDVHFSMSFDVETPEPTLLEVTGL